MRRNTTLSRMLPFFACVWFAQAAPAQQPAEPAHNEVVIKNAIVMTVTHGNLKNGSIYIKDGKIAAVGESVNAPAGAAVIDAGGKYVTPGSAESPHALALDE